jgi:hypothetical protein
MSFFGIGFTVKDVVRGVWAFLAGALAYVSLAATEVVEGSVVDTNALIYGAVVAGLVSVKNLFLADGTTIKG